MGTTARYRPISSTDSAAAWAQPERGRARRAAFAICLFLAACAPAAPAPPLPEPRAEPVHLEPADAEWLARLLRAEDRRSSEPELIRAALAHPLPEVRRRAALAAGRIGDRRVAAVLRNALGDDDPAVRADAAFALGLLRDTTAVPELAALALGEHGATSDAREAVAALGLIGEARALRAVEDALRRIEAPAVAAEALLWIWRFGRQPHTAELVLPYADVMDPEIRWRAVYALMRLRDPAAADVLARLLVADDDAPVRALAARGLDAATVDSAGARDTARTALLSALADPHPHVRIAALRSLAGFAEPGLADRIADRLTDPNANVAVAATEALGGLGGERAARALTAVLADREVHPTVRRSALVALAGADQLLAIDAIDRAAASEDWLDRLYAARALAATWPGSDLQATGLARDPDPRVAAAALAALADADEATLGSAHTIFLGGLGSRHVAVRAAALRGLARLAEPSDLPLLLDAYDAAARDQQPDAALAALEALAQLAANGLPVARSFYRRFGPPDDPRVHARAAELLASDAWGPPAQPGHGRDLDFYRRVVADLILPELTGAARPRAVIQTGGGAIELELLGADSPLTVQNFISLASSGYYDGARWHRVVPYFVLQDGDPRGDGLGGPGYTIRDEINRVRYDRGTLGMAHSGPDTAGSQFFITHAAQPHLDGGYTVFGHVAAGMDVADGVVQDDPIESVRITAAEPREDR